MDQQFFHSMMLIFELAIIFFVFFFMIFIFMYLIDLVQKFFCRRKNNHYDKEIEVLNTAMDDMDKDIEKIFYKLQTIEQRQDMDIGTKFLPDFTPLKRKPGRPPKAQVQEKTPSN